MKAKFQRIVSGAALLGALFTASVAQAQDFSVSNLRFSASNIEQGKPVSVSFSVYSKRGGSGISLQVPIASSAGSVIHTQNFTNQSFSKEQTRNFSFSYTIPNTLAVGSYNAHVKVIQSGTLRLTSGKVSFNVVAPTTTTSPTPTAPATCQFAGMTIQSGGAVIAYLAGEVPYDQTCKSEVRSCSNGVLSGTYAHATCKVLPAPQPDPVADDPCSGTPARGTICKNGTIYAGVHATRKMMIMPSGCDTSLNPTCSGGVDGLWLPHVDAAAYCSNVTFGGYSDWVLPTVSELAYLYCHAADVPEPTISRTGVLPPQSDPGCRSSGLSNTLQGFNASISYWPSASSSTTDARQVYFLNGMEGTSPKTWAWGIRCVRKY